MAVADEVRRSRSATEDNRFQEVPPSRLAPCTLTGTFPGGKEPWSVLPRYWFLRRPFGEWGAGAGSGWRFDRIETGKLHGHLL